MRAIPWVVLLALVAGSAWWFLRDDDTHAPEAFLEPTVGDEADVEGPGLAGQHRAEALTGTPDDAPIRFVVRGRVEGPDGAPVADVPVAIHRRAPAWGGSNENQRAYARWLAGRVGRHVRAVDGPTPNELLAEATSNAEGKFTLSLRRGGDCLLTATPAAPFAARRLHLRLTTQWSDREYVLRLLAGHALRGRVLTHDDKPVQAFVTAAEPTTAAERRWQLDPIATDDHGRFAIAGAPEGAVQMTVVVPGHIMFSTQVETPQDDEVILRVPRGDATIAGQVEDADGMPIPAATIMVAIDRSGVPHRQRRVSYKAQSDDTGRFRIDHAAAGALGHVSTVAKGFLDQSQRPPLAPWSGTIIPDKGSVPLRIVMHRGGSVSGTVRLGPDGPPIEGARVTVLTPQQQIQFTSPDPVVTGPDGRYTLVGVPAGKNIIYAEHAEHYMPAIEDTRAARTPPPDLLLLMPPGGATLARDLIMARGLSVRGVVVQADGQPVPGADIVAKSHGLGQRTWTWGVNNTADSSVLGQAGADGAFEVRNLAPREDWVLGARKAGYLGEYAKPFALSAESGAAPPLTLKLRPGARVEGVVLDGEGGPVEGAWINIWSASQAVRASTSITSAHDGTFSMDGLPPGNANLQVSTPSGLTARQKLEGLVENETLRGIEVRLGGGEVVEGVLVDKDDKPVAHQLLMLQSHQGEQRGTGTTDEHGRFKFEHVPAGLVRFASWIGGAQLDVSEAFTVPAHDLRIVFLASKPMIVDITILDDAGNPVPLIAAKVKARSTKRSDYFANRAQDVANGRLLRQIPAKFPIQVQLFDPRDGDGNALNLKPKTFSIPDAEQGVQEVRLEKGGFVRGVVLGPGGVALPGTTLSVGETSTFTNEQGEFELVGLAGESVKISVTPKKGYVKPPDFEAQVGREDVVIHVIEALTIAGVVEGTEGSGTLSGWISATWKAEGDRPGGSASGRVQPDGSFRLEGIAPDVRVSLRVQMWGSGRTNAPLTMDNVVPGDQNVRLVMQAGIEVSGTVRTADGGPPSGKFYVSVMQNNSYVGGATTDENGAFKIHVGKAGAYVLRVRAMNGGAQLPTKEVTAPIRDVRFELPRTTFLRGRIDGDYEGFQVRLLNANTSSNGKVVKVKPDGTWSFDEVPEGQDVIVIAQRRDSDDYARSKPIAPGTDDVVLRLQRGERIEGTVKDPHGDPLASGWVMASAKNWRSYVNPKGGKFSLRGLPPGNYTIFGFSTADQSFGQIEQVAVGRTDVHLEIKPRN